MSKEEADAQKEGLLSRFKLQDYAKSFVTELSGGLRQRFLIARALMHKPELVILDEPTVGLHAEDVKKLLEVINKLVHAGNTVLVVEHNLDVIKSADHVIDLGPEGGEAGGRVIAEGTPEEVALTPGSYTGMYLKGVLSL